MILLVKLSGYTNPKMETSFMIFKNVKRSWPISKANDVFSRISYPSNLKEWID